MIKIDFLIDGGLFPVYYKLERNELGIRYHSDINLRFWANNVDLAKIEPEYLDCMVKSLYKFSDFDVLIIWNYFFINKSMNEIEEIFNYTVTQQRTVYNKYRKACQTCLTKFNASKV